MRLLNKLHAVEITLDDLLDSSPIELNSIEFKKIKDFSDFIKMLQIEFLRAETPESIAEHELNQDKGL